MSLVNIAAIEL